MRPRASLSCAFGWCSHQGEHFAPVAQDWLGRQDAWSRARAIDGHMKGSLGVVVASQVEAPPQGGGPSYRTGLVGWSVVLEAAKRARFAGLSRRASRPMPCSCGLGSSAPSALRAGQGSRVVARREGLTVAKRGPCSPESACGTPMLVACADSTAPPARRSLTPTPAPREGGALRAS